MVLPRDENAMLLKFSEGGKKHPLIRLSDLGVSNKINSAMGQFTHERLKLLPVTLSIFSVAFAQVSPLSGRERDRKASFLRH